ncbi:MAG: hypothetical protein OHK0019_24250 [Saprospiraceae bacterium]
MNRLVTFSLLFLLPTQLPAQITWITDCSDKEFCLNQGSCTEGNVFLSEKAVTACFNSPLVSYSYKIDLFNDGNTDISSSQDTMNGPLPVGKHKISWRATDNCANIANCTYFFTIKDCQPPNLLCINSLSQDVFPNCQAAFDASDFVLSLFDNCTPTNELILGIRKAGEGMGFPNQTSIVYEGCDLGPHEVEIWVKDENNLISLCIANAQVQDNSNSCGCSSNLTLEGCAFTADSAKLGDYTMQADLASLPPSVNLSAQQNVSDSCYSKTFNDLEKNGNFRIVVRSRRNDDPLNGVSTFDLVQTSKHILNLEPFQSAYQRLAADVNASNSVTTFDIVETRKLILGIYDTFPKVQSWRFIQPLADPSNLLSAAKDTYQITINNLNADTTLSDLDFVGIKMGDSNLSAPAAPSDANDRSPLLLNVEDRFLTTGETAFVAIRLADTSTLLGWQMAFSVDPARARIEGVEGLPEENFSILKNEIRALWFDPDGKHFSKSQTLFYLKIKALQPMSVAQVLSLTSQKIVSEAYLPAGKNSEQRHTFVLGFDTKQANGTTFFPPRPNPFSTETTFSFLLSQPSEVRLEVFDLSGKMIFEQQTEVGAGYQSLLLQASSVPREGVFFYRIRVNGEVFSGRLVRG